jgi:hypothetical protein
VYIFFLMILIIGIRFCKLTAISNKDMIFII